MKITFYKTVESEEEIDSEKVKINEIKKYAESIILLLIKRDEDLSNIKENKKGMPELPIQYFKEIVINLSDSEYILKRIDF